MVLYEGIFFDEETIELIHSLDNNKLERIYEDLHCTFKFMPKSDEIFNDIVGKSFELLIVGYGNDGKNSGFQVALPDKLLKYYKNSDKKTKELVIPHITVSLSENGKAVDTGKLKFEKLNKPIKIIGKFGFYLRDKDKDEISFKPYTQTKSIR